MTVELWINALSALGTVGATAVAAYSARLAWKQVAYQFEPRLIVVPTGYQVAMHKGALNEFWWREPSDAAKYALCYGAYLMVAHETEEEARRTQSIPVTLRVEYTTTRGTRVVDRLKMRLAVRGGQFATDHSDGVILISIGPA